MMMMIPLCESRIIMNYRVAITHMILEILETPVQGERISSTQPSLASLEQGAPPYFGLDSMIRVLGKHMPTLNRAQLQNDLT